MNGRVRGDPSARARAGVLSAAALLAGLLITVPLWSAAGATGGWTLTASPTSVQLGMPTNISLTATNVAGGASLGCVEIQPTPEWTVNSVRIDFVSRGLNWVADPVSAGTNLVVVHAVKDSDILKVDNTDKITVSLNVTGTKVGTYTWNASSRDKGDCKAGIDDAWLSMSVVGTPPAPTPTPPPATPFPTGRPVSTPSAAATAAPSATGTTATVTPSAKPVPSVTPASTSATSASASSVASQPVETSSPSAPPLTPQPSLTPRPSQDPFVVPGGGTEGGGGDGFSVDFGDIWWGNGVVWIVPGIALTVPGLLLALIVLAQAFGGAVWLPLARRRIGEFGISRR